jgi:hypothetical protein
MGMYAYLCMYIQVFLSRAQQKAQQVQLAGKWLSESLYLWWTEKFVRPPGHIMVRPPRDNDRESDRNDSRFFYRHNVGLNACQAAAINSGGCSWNYQPRFSDIRYQACFPSDDLLSSVAKPLPLGAKRDVVRKRADRKILYRWILTRAFLPYISPRAGRTHALDMRPQFELLEDGATVECTVCPPRKGKPNPPTRKGLRHIWDHATGIGHLKRLETHYAVA